MEFDKDAVELLINSILDDYYNYYRINAIDIEFRFSNQFSKTFMEKRPDLFEGDKKLSPEQFHMSNGCVIPPKELDDKFTILIHLDYFMDLLKEMNYSWVGTFTHELTHILDFIQYAKLHHMNNYDAIQRDMEHRPFTLWTEYNARSKGYFFVRKYVFRDKVNDMNDTSQTEIIKNKELPYYINEFEKKYSEADRNAWYQMYVATQFLGRYSVWEKLFPNVFTKSLRVQVLGSNKWVLELYQFFINNKTLEVADANWKDLLDIESSNWKGI